MLSSMVVTHRLSCLILALALIATSAIATVHASGMADEIAGHNITAEMSGTGMSEPMPDGCPDCDQQAAMLACMQTLCAIFSAIMPRESTLLVTSLPTYPAARNENGMGFSRLPDPKPPRATFLG